MKESVHGNGKFLSFSFGLLTAFFLLDIEDGRSSFALLFDSWFMRCFSFSFGNAVLEELIFLYDVWKSTLCLNCRVIMKITTF